jgi:hypothetical protein
VTGRAGPPTVAIELTGDEPGSERANLTGHQDGAKQVLRMVIARFPLR